MYGRKRKYGAGKRRQSGVFAKKTMAVVKKSVPMPELKYYDTNDTKVAVQSITGAVVPFAVSNYATGAAGSCRILNNMVQGAGVDQRLGRKILNAYLELSYQIRRSDEDSTVTGGYARVIVLWDKQPNNAAAGETIADVLDGADPQQLKNHNLNNRQRYVFLYDRKHFLPSEMKSSLSTAPAFGLSVKKKINLGRAATTFSGVGAGDSTVLTDISTGALVALVFGTYTTNTATTGYYCWLHTRLRYYDS